MSDKLNNLQIEDSRKPSIQFSLRPIINVAVLGCVSVGKSTFLNMMMTRMFSDCHIKRTTTMPQIYYEITEAEEKDTESKEGRGLSDLKAIRNLNSNINDTQMKEQAKSGVALKLEDIRPSEYVVPPIKGFAKLQSDKHGNGVTLAIHDMPGLNDSISRDIYFDYVRQNFNKYDVAIFILDIHSSLNTSDEVAILDLILEGIKKNKFNKIETKLMVLMNKCDNLEIHEKLEPIPEDVELQEMLDQARDIIWVRAKELGVDISDCQIACVSSEDSFVYRMIEANRFKDLDIKYINRIGQLEFPARTWKKFSDSEKRKKVNEAVVEEGPAEGLKMSGFFAFKKKFEKLMDTKTQYNLCFNRINNMLVDIQDSNKLDIGSELSWYHIVKVVIHNTNRIFKKKLDANFDEFNSKFGTFLQNHMIFLTNTLESIKDVQVLKRLKNIQSEWKLKLNMKSYDIVEEIENSITSRMKVVCASQLSDVSRTLEDLESIINTIVKNKIYAIKEIRSMMMNIYQYSRKNIINAAHAEKINAAHAAYVAKADAAKAADTAADEVIASNAAKVHVLDAIRTAYAADEVIAIHKFIMEIPEETGICLDDRHLALAKASVESAQNISQTERLSLGRLVKSYKIESTHPYWYISQMFSINIRDIPLQDLLYESKFGEIYLEETRKSLPGLFLKEVFTS
jgi:GTP-binding protein EngB required for normal cell division